MNISTQKYVWLAIALTFAGILTFSYFSSHQHPHKGETTLVIPEELYTDLLLRFEKEELILAQAVLKENDSAKKLIIEKKLNKKLGIKLIALLRYNVEDELFKEIISFCGTGNPTKLIEELPCITATKTTWFWFNGNKRYLEVLYWGLFGVVCSLLFNVTQALKTNAFNPKLIPDHLAKLFYGPVVVLVIFFSFDKLSVGTTWINIVPEGYGLIIFAFILGFFSRRSMALLNTAKTIIFPADSKVKEKPTTESGQTQNDAYSKLPLEKKKKLINEAKKSHLKKWMQQFENIQSVTKGYKKVNDQETGIYCLIFQVSTKETLDNLKQIIPTYIAYKAEDGIEYQLPTDIEVVGNTSTDSYTSGKPHIICNTLPFNPGCSIARKGEAKNTGTLGLKVFRNEGGKKTYYLASCYHVLCAPELKNKVENFNNSKQKDVDIIAPSKEDGGGNSVATLTEGYVSDSFDCAIAELKNETDVLADIKLMHNAPSGILEIEDEHENVLDIRMTGRTSNYQSGIIVENWTSAQLEYTDEVRTLFGLIATTKISDGGDSGAFVFDKYGSIIGMLIGSNIKYSYLIPAKRIFNNLNIQPCFID